jgi:hypothetical protein
VAACAPSRGVLLCAGPEGVRGKVRTGAGPAGLRRGSRSPFPPRSPTTLSARSLFPARARSVATNVVSNWRTSLVVTFVAGLFALFMQNPPAAAAALRDTISEVSGAPSLPLSPPLPPPHTTHLLPLSPSPLFHICFCRVLCRRAPSPSTGFSSASSPPSASAPACTPSCSSSGPTSCASQTPPSATAPRASRPASTPTSAGPRTASTSAASRRPSPRATRTTRGRSPPRTPRPPPPRAGR